MERVRMRKEPLAPAAAVDGRAWALRAAPVVGCWVGAIWWAAILGLIAAVALTGGCAASSGSSRQTRTARRGKQKNGEDAREQAKGGEVKERRPGGRKISAEKEKQEEEECGCGVRVPKAVERAVELAERGDVDGAIKVLSAFVEKNPKKYRARRVLADILVSDDRAEEACKLLRAGIRNSRADGFLWLHIGHIRRRQAIQGPFVKRRRGVITYQAGDPRKEKEYQQKRWNLALKAYTRALRWLPNNLAANVGRAISLHHAGSPKDAVAVWRKLAKRFPKEPRIWIGMAQSLIDAKAGLSAVAQALRQALAIDPRLAEAHFALAAIHESRGETKQAESRRKKARFYAWLPPFLKADFSEERYRKVTILAGRDLEAKKKLLEELADDESGESTALLAAYCWHNPDHGVLESMAFAVLEQRRAASMLKVLIAHAKSLSTIRHAVGALVRLRAPGVLPILIQLLPYDTNGFFPMFIAQGMAELGDERAVPHLLSLLEWEPPSIRSDMSSAKLFAIFGRQMAQVRAVVALASFDKPKVRSALKKAAARSYLELYCYVSLYVLTRIETHLEKAAEYLESNPNEVVHDTLIEAVLDSDRSREVKAFLVKLKAFAKKQERAQESRSNPRRDVRRRNRDGRRNRRQDRRRNRRQERPSRPSGRR